MRIYVVLLAAFFAAACSTTPDKRPQTQAQIHYDHGTEELINGNYTQAIGHLLKAVELDEKNPEIHNNLGMAYYFKGEKDLAYTHIRRSLELNPKNTDARVNLASMLFERGDLDGAEKQYLHALKDLAYEKHARTYYNMALIELRRNHTEKARAHLQASVKEDSDYCPSWLQLGQIDLQARRLKDAAKSFKEARMGICTNTPAPLYWQAVVDAELGDYLNARMKLDELQNKFPNTPYSPMAQQKLSEITLMENRPQGNRANINSAPQTPSF